MNREELAKYLLEVAAESIRNPLGLSIEITFDTNLYRFIIRLREISAGQINEFRVSITNEEAHRKDPILRRKIRDAERSIRG